MNEKTLFNKIVDMELQALAKYCDYNNIDVKDYVNADVMGDSDYIEYANLYKEHFKECFECGEKQCDDDCPYQMYLYRIES